MSELDPVHEALERLEWADSKQEETPATRMRAMSRRAAPTGGAAGIASAMLAACGSSKPDSAKATATATAAQEGGSSIFAVSKKLKFVLVNHVTTNPFFVPTKYGAEDACKLLGCSYQWTGSETSNVNEMVNAMNAAITSGANGIGVCLVDKKAFNGPTDSALKAKIPVVAYNADEKSNNRLCYIGQDLFVSGQQMGERIKDLVGSGDVALFIATPGSSNIQPRIDGAQQALKGSSVKPHVVSTGAAVPAELSVIDSYATGHPDTKGYFAVDAGSTQGLAQTIQKHSLRNKGVKGGGYDLTPVTQKLLAADQIDFTIDQQPYLQGFIPILQLFMYQASGGLSGIADTNTGLKFLDKTTVVPYNDTKSRYEGTSTEAGVQK